MKRLIISVVVIVFGYTMYGQVLTHRDTVAFNNGIRYMVGVDRPLNYNRAIQIFSMLANRGYSEAYTKLGYMALRGFGQDKSETDAFKLFAVANKLGSMAGSFDYAYCFRKGVGVAQDYFTAVTILDSCANLNHLPSIYSVGEMMYKGYGIEQNYDKAIEYFKKGAEQGDKNCLYMMGVASAEGFGIERDVEKSKEYLTKAMIKGHSWVEDVIEMNILDSVTIAATSRVKSSVDATDSLNLVRNNIDETDISNSFWKGELTTYDWSGKFVAKEIPITVCFSKDNVDTVNVVWREYTRDEYKFKLYKADGLWRIKSFEQISKHRNNYEIKGVLLGKLNQDELHGSLCNYSNSTKDRMMPSYFVLKQVAETEYNKEEDNFTIAKVYPNPFQAHLKLYLSLKTDDRLSVDVYNIYGQKVYNYPARNYEAGNFSLEMSINGLPKGTYLIKVSGNSSTSTRTIQKEE